MPETAQRLIDFTIERDKEIARRSTSTRSRPGRSRPANGARPRRRSSRRSRWAKRGARSRVFDRQTITYLEGLGLTNHPGLIGDW